MAGCICFDGRYPLCPIHGVGCRCDDEPNPLCQAPECVAARDKETSLAALQTQAAKDREEIERLMAVAREASALSNGCGNVPCSVNRVVGRKITGQHTNGPCSCALNAVGLAARAQAALDAAKEPKT